MIRSHRIALDPTDRQATLLLQHCGYARLAANWARGRFRLAWFGHTNERQAPDWYAHVDVDPAGGEWLYDTALRRDFNAVKRDLFPWSTGLSQAAAKNAIINMGKGLDAWGKYKKARKHGQPARRVGFPKMRKRHCKLAYTASNGRNSIKVDGNRVRLPVVGWVRMRECLRFEGGIGEVTISKTGHRWFAAIQVHTADEQPDPRPGPDIGIDMGVKVLATVWDGEEVTEIENPAPLRAKLKALRRLDKAIARSQKVHGKHNRSNQRDKLYAQRRQLHIDIANLRSDHHHKATTKIAKRGGTVKVETLNVDGMKKNRRLARAISDAGMAEFARQLEYKCRIYGTEFVRIDRWYPSSKTCSDCGAVKQSLLLSERTYRCHRCGFECDRDANAARNIQAFDTGHRAAARIETTATRPARSAGHETTPETRESSRIGIAASGMVEPAGRPALFDQIG